MLIVMNSDHSINTDHMITIPLPKKGSFMRRSFRFIGMLRETDVRIPWSSLGQVVLWGSTALGLCGLLLALVFLPLGLSFVEHSLYNTTHIEDWFQTVGLHDDLGRVYEPIIEWMRKVVP